MGCRKREMHPKELCCNHPTCGMQKEKRQPAGITPRQVLDMSFKDLYLSLSFKDLYLNLKGFQKTLLRLLVKENFFRMKLPRKQGLGGRAIHANTNINERDDKGITRMSRDCRQGVNGHKRCKDCKQRFKLGVKISDRMK